jgi:hypothetical protein
MTRTAMPTPTSIASCHTGEYKYSVP